jgi:hypothetical protein
LNLKREQRRLPPVRILLRTSKGETGRLSRFLC